MSIHLPLSLSFSVGLSFTARACFFNIFTACCKMLAVLPRKISTFAYPHTHGGYGLVRWWTSTVRAVSVSSHTNTPIYIYKRTSAVDRSPQNIQHSSESTRAVAANVRSVCVQVCACLHPTVVVQMVRDLDSDGLWSINSHRTNRSGHQSNWCGGSN